ncbi:MAG: disulfide bond formation protein B [Geminicoccaceae bacterium]|nr:disulfide bond formation protein B [Geminicoccaceae bacterium]
MTARPALAALVAASVLALLVAYGLQHLGGLRPCHFCLLERWPYGGIALFGGIALGFRFDTLGLALAALLLLGEAGLALYHVGIEAGVFQLSAGCIAGSGAGSVAELKAQMMNAPPTCDQVTARLFGLSLAAWNAIFALVLLFLATMTLAWDYFRR